MKGEVKTENADKIYWLLQILHKQYLFW